MPPDEADSNEFADRDRPWTDPDILYELYVERDLSQRDCGVALGCSGSNVSKWLKKFDISARDPWEHNAPVDFGGCENLRRLYIEDGLTAAAIGKQYDCHETVVLRRLREYGIPIRNRGTECTDPRLNDADALRQLHHVQWHSTIDIADELGCDPKTVRRRLREFEIPVRSGASKNFGLDRDTLYSLYVEQELTRTEIGERFDCDSNTVRNRLNEHGIPIRTQDPPVELTSERQLRELYVLDGLTAEEVADETGCHATTAYRWLDRHEIDRRHPGDRSDAEEALRDKPLLKRLYVNEELGSEALAERLGCGSSSVLRWLGRHGIKIRPPGSPVSGEDHPWWRGGVGGHEYGRPYWKNRSQAIERDKERCRRCGLHQLWHQAVFGHDIECHHVEPFDPREPIEPQHRLANLITLCHRCHRTMQGLPIDNRQCGE